MIRQVSWALIALATLPGAAPAGDAPSALTIRLVGPDRQLQELLDLFQGARAPHPAAALANWKRATGGAGFSKTAEAGIAALNPGMVRELKTFADAEFRADLDPASGQVRWTLALPADDGTFAALATALALTDGAAEPPVEGAAVDRLGPPGAPVLARLGPAVALAARRDDLPDALARARVRPEPGTEAPGLLFRIDPERLAPAGPVPRRRGIEALRGLGGRGIDGAARLDRGTFTLAVATRQSPPPADLPPLDPAWLDALPASGTAAAVALAFDPRPEAWDGAFALADRLDRADPARAGLAPLRTRLNVLAAGLGLRPEADLWPHLRGLSAAFSATPGGGITGAVVFLHADSPEAAARLAGPFLDRLAAPLLRGPAGAPEADGTRRLGTLSGQPLRVSRVGATVRLLWGDPPAAVPGESIGAILRPGWGPHPPRRAGVLWPGLLPGLAPPGSPLAAALADAPPVVWHGTDEGPVTRDVLTATGLPGAVRRFLERLPMRPFPGEGPQ